VTEEEYHKKKKKKHKHKEHKSLRKDPKFMRQDSETSSNVLLHTVIDGILDRLVGPDIYILFSLVSVDASYLFVRNS